MNKQAKSYNYIKACSLNTNRSNAAMHAIVDIQNPAFDLLLVQEPWWDRLDQAYRTTSFPGWQTILPILPLRNNERPCIAAYFRKEGSNKTPTCIINLYNQKSLGENQTSGWTLDRLKEADIDTNTPTIIMGDWNTHHPDWDESINTPDPRAREIVEWLEGSNFSLCNEPYVPTREDCSGHASVINLTFKNVAENGANILSGHHI